MAKLKFQYVQCPFSPESLLDFLLRRFPYHSPAEWEKRILDGYVTIQGKKVAPSHILRTKHLIEYQKPSEMEPEVDRRFTVLYEDGQLLAVDKSGNIPTSPSGKYWDNCLVHVLQKELNLPGLMAVHRLDRETSGINLFAKTKEAAALLGDDFSKGRLEKDYSAILQGVLAKRETLVDGPLGKAPHSLVHIKQAVIPEGRPSQTWFKLQAVLPGACLTAIRPITGRTHQIRAHAFHIGHPVWGDKLYGQPEESFIQWLKSESRDSADRQLLHASTLTITHPATGAPLTIHSPPRVLMELFLNQLKRNGAGLTV